jgi:hypothetical protein
LPGALTLSKTAKSPTFIAGQPIIFDVVAANTGKGWLQKQVIVDDLEAITTELSGGATGKP